MNEVPRIIQIPQRPDKRGNLSFFEGLNHIPFKIARTFWIYDVPGGEKRGGHAYRKASEFIISLSGSFDIVVNGRDEATTFTLNRSYYGLFIPSMFWREMNNFSTNAVALVVSSIHFDEADYIRDFMEFKELKNA
jgi:hypothetical protein